MAADRQRRIRKADLPRDELGRLRAPGDPDEMAHLKGLADRIDDPAEAWERGLALFDEERFFEAYVHLALAWKRSRSRGQRGLAQVAAGLCHVQRGNLEGARAVLARGRALLDGEVPRGLAPAELRRRVDVFLTGLDAGAARPFPRLPRTDAAVASAPMSIPEPVKGAPDWLPPDAAHFDAVEAAFLDTARLAGYQRVRTPVFEHTEVFARGVGASTDVVQKEMYTFEDKGGRSLTLRPEGTAGVVRAALNAGVPRAGSLPVKYSYTGEFFRYERPQSGRQRQFNQVGVEALGSDDPVLDAELVLLGWEALLRAGLRAEQLTLRLNSLGDRDDRAAYGERLNDYLSSLDDLPEDVAARRHLNPLRAFDSKAPGMAEAMARAPKLIDHIGPDAKAHHATVVAVLEDEGVPLTHDPMLVRGLDYYSRTTFEYQAAGLGAQNAVGGGGRYDGLAEDLGYGDRFPGIGWALGIDRTLLALRGDPTALPTRRRVDVFVIAIARDLGPLALQIAGALRRAGVSTDLGFDGRSAKAQFKLADRAGAATAVVLGPDEVARDVVTVKDLVSGEQQQVPRANLVAYLAPPLQS